VQCASKPDPKWRLYYIPKHCNTMVFESFAAEPAPYEFAVVRIHGWTGRRMPGEAKIYPGEDFSGDMALGRSVVHDISNGYDLDVTVIYGSDSTDATKARAADDCRRKRFI
jgi:hypothetical protein